MTTLGALGFLNPWVLAGLAALPVLWFLLRAVPPTPRRQLFAPVRLLFGLEDREREADRTPWWLVLLRMLAIAAALVGFAQPVLNPDSRVAPAGEGPLLLLMDQGWASAPDWQERRAAAAGILESAAEQGRQVVFWPLAGTDEVPPEAPAVAMRGRLDGTTPAAWAPARAAVARALDSGTLAPPSETVWLHDGLAHGTGTSALLDRLAAAGPVTLIGPETPARAVTPPRLEEGRLAVDVLRPDGGSEVVAVAAVARGETGAERRVGVAEAEFAPGETRATATFDLPREIVQDVSRVVLTEGASAGGAALATGAIRRVSAAIVDPRADAAVASLTSAEHYLREALVPWADAATAGLGQVLSDDPAAIVLADFGTIPAAERGALTDWVEGGGLLVRFAGPRLAAAVNERFSAMQESDLLPVRLRRGGRVLGGALSWSQPKSVGPFPEDGPFRGLTPPEEVDVSTQVLADPAPDLERHVWARLDDGTPLVTGARLGEGHVVLVHVTADPEWSSLPLSGLFVEMLGRLMVLAPGQSPEPPSADALEGTLWRADLVLGTDGTPRPASDAVAPVPGARIAGRAVGPGLPPGLYARADPGERAPGEAGEIVVPLMDADAELSPFPDPPAGVAVETLGGAETRRLDQWFLLAALALAAVDVLASLWLSGRLAGRWRPAAGAAALALAVATSPGGAAAQGAQTDARAVEATAETTLAYLVTGDAETDRVSRRALVGLGRELTRRTAVEPGPPHGVDPGEDALAFYPVIYWPLRGDTIPSETGLARLADYLADGGMLLIDTQNGASGFGGASAAEMRNLARTLNLPPLEPLDGDHVLTRTFYLLDRFPGRWRGGRIWAEAGGGGRPADDEGAGLPRFDRVDDNVSPVIVGSADWASAWAVDESGRPLFPIGRAGGRQRELATRFGVNLVMYALTGNYKSDQVHAPEVLRRLGQ